MQQYPNVLYIGQSVPAMVLEPIHLAFWRLANVRTLWVPSSAGDVVRGQLTRSVKRMVLPPSLRRVLYHSSVLASKLSEGVDATQLQNLPIEPDLIFVAEIYKKIEGLSSFSCRKAYYIQDPHVSIKRYLDFANLGDYNDVFITQSDYVPTVKEAGYANVHWLPVAWDPEVILGPSGVRDLNVVFIGHRDADPERQEMVSMLERRFGGVNPTAYLRDMAAVLRRSKIVFNKSRGGDLSPRIFDGMGAGAFVVTDRIRNGLFELFRERAELVTFSNENELEAAVDYFLKHEDERQAISKRGHELVLAKHTYLHRAAQVLSISLDVDRIEAVEAIVQSLKASI